MIDTNVKTIQDLTDYLTRVCSAYRRSYKLLSRVNKGILITSGIISGVGALAAVPAIPVFISLLAAVPIVVTVVNQNLKLSDKVSRLKVQYKNFKELLTYTQANIYSETPQELIREVFMKSLEMQKTANYTPPLERYLKYYKLNGYSDPGPRGGTKLTKSQIVKK